jgi:hypothetical protein
MADVEEGFFGKEDPISLEDFRRQFTFELRDLNILEQAMDRMDAQEHVIQKAVTWLDEKRDEWFVDDGDPDNSWDSHGSPIKSGNDPEQLREPVAA